MWLFLFWIHIKNRSCRARSIALLRREGRSRCLLERGRARVRKLCPFTIRLVDRLVEESVLVLGVKKLAQPLFVPIPTEHTLTFLFDYASRRSDSQKNATANKVSTQPEISSSSLPCTAF